MGGSCIAVNHGFIMHRNYATKKPFKIKAVFWSVVPLTIGAPRKIGPSGVPLVQEKL